MATKKFHEVEAHVIDSCGFPDHKKIYGWIIYNSSGGFWISRDQWTMEKVYQERDFWICFLKSINNGNLYLGITEIHRNDEQARSIFLTVYMWSCWN